MFSRRRALLIGLLSIFGIFSRKGIISGKDVISTIGPNGDYPTFAAWEADLNNSFKYQPNDTAICVPVSK